MFIRYKQEQCLEGVGTHARSERTKWEKHIPRRSLLCGAKRAAWGEIELSAGIQTNILENDKPR